ncbi:MAG: hypothetical protein R3B59_04340 [Dehalococcoidia bacterium]
MSRRAFVGSLRQRWTGQRATESVEEPVEPQFPDDIGDIEAAARARVGRPRLPALAARTHPVIAGLIAEDAERRANPHSWSKPRFEGPEAQRRLRVANGLFFALERVGVESGFQGHGEPRFGATVGHTWVPISMVSGH